MAKQKQDIKSLHVEIVDNVPTFEFVGDWTGRDIIQVRNHMFKSYRINQRKVRRIPSPSKEEAK